MDLILIHFPPCLTPTPCPNTPWHRSHCNWPCRCRLAQSFAAACQISMPLQSASWQFCNGYHWWSLHFVSPLTGRLCQKISFLVYFKGTLGFSTDIFVHLRWSRGKKCNSSHFERKSEVKTFLTPSKSWGIIYGVQLELMEWWMQIHLLSESFPLFPNSSEFFCHFSQTGIYYRDLLLKWFAWLLSMLFACHYYESCLFGQRRWCTSIYNKHALLFRLDFDMHGGETRGQGERRPISFSYC